MYRTIKKYQKKLLAIFAVLLMIAFLATLGPGSLSGRGPRNNDVVVGHFNGKELYDRELQAGKDQWQILMRTPVSSRQMFGQQMPLPFAVLPFPVVEDIQKHPELFVLLQKDAISRGVNVTEDEARTLWVNQLGRPAEMVSQGDVQAIQGILTIVGEYQQLASTLKVSRPMWRREAAQQFQGVRLNLVDFTAGDFDKSVPAPATQQLTEHFEKYKNTPARAADSTGDDSLGFGYQIPTRVKVQYFEIPHADVVASLQPTPETQYEWAVKAAVYYRAHQDEFRNPVTLPATQAATQMAASQPAATQAASTRPAIKPFDEVKTQIISKLMTDDVAKQTALIEKELTSKLAADWVGIRKANEAATRPATTQTAAASQPTLPEMTLARLEQIRADIQKSMHVSINIHELNDWQDSKQLGILPGIGNAQTTDHDSFPEYALHFTGQRGMVTAVPLQIFEPSQPLTDTAQNAYVFRLTAAEPAHAPSDMTPILAQVTKDWRTAQAYELAKQSAIKLAASAKTLGLAQASRTAGLTMVTTGPFSPRSPRAIQGYLLTDFTALQNLGQTSRKLLEEASTEDPHPSLQFELPTVQRAGVAEIASAQLEFPEDQVQFEIIANEQQTNKVKLAEDYFAYDAVVERLSYKAEPKAGS